MIAESPYVHNSSHRKTYCIVFQIYGGSPNRFPSQHSVSDPTQDLPTYLGRYM